MTSQHSDPGMMRHVLGIMWGGVCKGCCGVGDVARSGFVQHLFGLTSCVALCGMVWRTVGKLMCHVGGASWGGSRANKSFVIYNNYYDMLQVGRGACQQMIVQAWVKGKGQVWS